MDGEVDDASMADVIRTGSTRRRMPDEDEDGDIVNFFWPCRERSQNLLELGFAFGFGLHWQQFYKLQGTLGWATERVLIAQQRIDRRGWPA